MDEEQEGQRRALMERRFWGEYEALMGRLRELELLALARWGRGRPSAEEAQMMRDLRLRIEALEVGFSG